MLHKASLGRRLGASIEGEGTRFSAFTTGARRCAIRLFDDAEKRGRTIAMEARGDGVFEVFVPGVGHGALYKFVLDDVRELPDPYARFLPYGVHGPAMVYESRYAFRRRGVSRPLAEQVIYELHVGTFSEAGTYEGVRARLPELVDLGVTTLELMPVSSFPGARGWGYDGVAHFAPYAPYGLPDDLRALIDDAHGHGLAVLLDVVYNHFGPSGNYLAAYASEYFSTEIKNAWGDAPNFAHPAMRAYVLDNVRYWLEEFRFDGLRLDAVHAMIDRTEPHVLRDLVAVAQSVGLGKILIAEDDRNEPSLVVDVGLDALWADDFHHQVRVTLTGERDGYYAAYEPGVAGLARVIERGWLYEGQTFSMSETARGKPADELPSQAFVYCIQNHDQVGNRARGERLSADVTLDAYCMVSALLLFLPTTPLLFMGQEWAAATPFLFFTDHDPELGKLVSEGRREEFKEFAAFRDPARRADIPDPQAEETFLRSRLNREERKAPEHARVLGLYRELLRLRREDPVLKTANRACLRAEAHGDELLLVRRFCEQEERLLALNFGHASLPLSLLGLPSNAKIMLSSRAETREGLLSGYEALLFAAPRAGGRS